MPIKQNTYKLASVTLPELMDVVKSGDLLVIALAILIAEILLSFASAAYRTRSTGWDFPVFYIAAHVPLSQIYSPSAYATFWREHLAPLGSPHWAPFVRPAIFALPLRVLLNGPYHLSLWLWLGSGILLYAASIFVLAWRFRLTVLFILACILYHPAFVGIASGADIAVYLLALVLSLILMEKQHPLRSALLLAFCLCKFNLILLFPFMLLVKRQFRAFAGLLTAAGLVVIGSLYLAPLDSYISIVRAAPGIAGGFYPVGLRGFSYAIGQPWCYLPLVAVTVCASFTLFHRLSLPYCFAVAITGSLMISPYVTWYDSVLLIFPIAIIYSNASHLTRYVCLAILVAIPLWVYGGGLRGQGYMHIGVEALIMAYFIQQALRKPLPEASDIIPQDSSGAVAGHCSLSAEANTTSQEPKPPLAATAS